MNFLISQKTFIISSYVMLVASMAGFILGVGGIWPKGEPIVILAISWLALVFSAYGNIISAQVNKKVENLDADTVETDTLKYNKKSKK